MPNKRGGEQSTTRPGSRDRPAKHIFAHILLIDDEPAWNGRSFPVTVAHDLAGFDIGTALIHVPDTGRSEEHTSELQSLMRISYAVFCLKKKKATTSQPLLLTQ